MRYRKKPVIIDAFQYDGDLKDRDGVADMAKVMKEVLKA